jgi:hypothetical protein
MYTLGPTTWTKHYSPMIGRLAGTKNPEDGKGKAGKTEKYEYCLPQQGKLKGTDNRIASKRTNFNFKVLYHLAYIIDLWSLSRL